MVFLAMVSPANRFRVGAPRRRSVRSLGSAIAATLVLGLGAAPGLAQTPEAPRAPLTLRESQPYRSASSAEPLDGPLTCNARQTPAFQADFLNLDRATTFCTDYDSLFADDPSNAYWSLGNSGHEIVRFGPLTAIAPGLEGVELDAAGSLETLSAAETNLVAIFPDGTQLLPGGAIVHPNGTRVEPNGTLILASEALALPDGAVRLPPVPATLPPGAMVLPAGTQLLPDGSALLPDDRLRLSDGTLLLPSGRAALDGAELLADGSRRLPSGARVQSDGTVVLAEAVPFRPQTFRPVPAATLPDGDRRLPDGSTLAADGTLTLLDGTAYRPDGTVVSPDGTESAPARAETDPFGRLVLSNGITVTAIERPTLRRSPDPMDLFGKRPSDSNNGLLTELFGLD